MDGQLLKEFLSLPVKPEETWQGGIATMADLMGIPTEEATSQISLLLWRGVPSDLVNARPVMADAEDAFDQFVETMLELAEEHGAPYRPAQIECNERRFADELSERLDGSGTIVQYRAKMDDWSEAIEDMASHVQSAASPSLPSLREAGCNDDQVGGFAAATAEFYRAKLWELLDDTDLIKIETPRPLRNLKYAVVLGSGGQSYGLGFYDHADDHHALIAQEVDPRELNLFSFTYVSPAEVVSDDVELWQELDLPLETGEAFPDINFFSGASADESRRPTPKEIEFLTVVLKGFAQTSEEELDTGRWTKWVQVSGKRKKCGFSIPNLLDPPDRAEWIRRGKMPDRRGHEIHFRQVQEFIDSAGEGMDIDQLNESVNARFTGRSLDDIELPRNTPAERAEALYQEALGCFGRRRTLLAREAIAEDSTHVEASILVAESTRAVDARIGLLENAKQAAAKALGEEMKELDGQFWEFHETRPYMRACHGVAVAYAEAGQPRAAIGQYREMLRLNPNDNQGVRYEIVPLLLEQECDAEAIEVLDQYPEESAMWLYMKALVEFRSEEQSTRAKRAIRAAFKGNDHVLKLMQSDEPPLMPESYALGSPEEAAICLEELQTVWNETEGFLEWMFQEYFVWERDRAKRMREQRRKKNAKKSKRKRGR